MIPQAAGRGEIRDISACHTAFPGGDMNYPERISLNFYAGTYFVILFLKQRPPDA